MKICGIYKITSPSKKIYIGQSINVLQRFKHYKLMHCKDQIRLYNSFKKYGVEKHLFEILLECDKLELNDKERYYQDLYSSITLKGGLNCILTKSLDRSGEMSDECKKKMSLKLIGNKHALGMKHTDETKKKISEAHKGNTYGLGNKWSDESKNKMSQQRKGLNCHPNTRLAFIANMKKARCKEVLHVEYGIIYESLKDAAASCGITSGCLQAQLKGRNSNRTNYIYI
jgi:group I intron endonuclease